jgi:hypothetical protein
VLDWEVAPLTLGSGILQLSKSGSDFTLHNCDDVRDFLSPKSIANILEKICEKSSTPSVVNLCSGEGITVGHAARRMLTDSGYKIPDKRMLSGNSSNPYIVGDNSKLRELLPDVDLTWSPSTHI